MFPRKNYTPVYTVIGVQTDSGPVRVTPTPVNSRVRFWTLGGAAGFGRKVALGLYRSPKRYLINVQVINQKTGEVIDIW